MSRLQHLLAFSGICLSLAFLLISPWSQRIGISTWFGKQKQPNIVFVLTDDQDLHMDSLAYMPRLKKHLADQGTTFTRHYCTVALCCPSRVSMWTGKAAHNTNVTDVNPPYGKRSPPFMEGFICHVLTVTGGYPKFISQGFNDKYFPIWMQSLGYATYYVGKLFNAQTVDNYASPPAAGWTGSEFLLDPYTYEYLNATFTRNGAKPVSYEGKYSTEIVAQKSFDFLDDALKEDKPFFLTIAPTAPHSNVHFGSHLIDGNYTEHSNVQSPPIAAEKYKDYFQGVRIPRTPAFNPDNPHGVSWISRLPKQNQTNVESNDHFYRQRLRALQSVDEIIDDLVSRLEAAGVLDETYIVFSTDNGYHIGQHRLQPGKQCAFEEDINIPLIIRGPGVPKNHKTDIVTSHTDIAPTLLSLAGGSKRTLPDVWREFDGSAIPLHAHSPSESRSEHVNVEMWGIIQSEGKYGATLHQNHTYKALRVIGKGYNLLYTVWCSGEHELYDLTRDPYETRNLYPRNHSSTHIGMNVHEPQIATAYDPTSEQRVLTPSAKKKIPLTKLLPRLDALLQVLRACTNTQCTHPWSSLHADGKVSNLREALDSKFDHFYQTQPFPVKFEKCEKGYIRESEGEIGFRPYLEGIGG